MQARDLTLLVLINGHLVDQRVAYAGASDVSRGVKNLLFVDLGAQANKGISCGCWRLKAYRCEKFSYGIQKGSLHGP